VRRKSCVIRYKYPFSTQLGKESNYSYSGCRCYVWSTNLLMNPFINIFLSINSFSVCFNSWYSFDIRPFCFLGKSTTMCVSQLQVWTFFHFSSLILNYPNLIMFIFYSKKCHLYKDVILASLTGFFLYFCHPLVMVH